MKRSRFSAEQIIGILREQEAGAATADVCRKHRISSATFYKWKGKFGGMEVSDVRRLKTLESENAKLKKLLAEAMLDNAMLRDIASEKWRRASPDARPWLTSASARSSEMNGPISGAITYWPFGLRWSEASFARNLL
jgi:putative transposase